MAITKLNRSSLNLEFRDGERPSGDDFASAWLSFINVIDDGVDKDANGNLVLSAGLKLNGTNDASLAGTLRFNSGQIQFHDGASFKNLSSGSAGAFLPVAGGPHVSFGGGNVGIGAFVSAPTHKLEVNLGNNSALDQRVKFGNFVVHNGSANQGAYACHTNQGGDASFALFQDNQGNTSLNSALNAQLIVSQNGVNRFRALTSGEIVISPTTNVTVTGNVIIGSSGTPRDLTVNGNAFKTVAGPFGGISDLRVKKDIQPYTEGLEKLLALKPVSYKFNGKASTPADGRDYIGLVAQDVREVLPDLISSRPAKFNEDDTNVTEVLTLQPGPLTYILINAIKELSERINKIEKSATDAKRKSKNQA